MMQINIKTGGGGPKVADAVFDAAWEGLVRATVFYHGKLRQELSVPNPDGFSPSKPGEPPRSVTGWLRNHVAFALKPTQMLTQIGLRENAKYGLFLEFGTKGPYKIRPRNAAFLRFQVMGADGKKHWVQRREVTHPGIEARPWLVATLKKYWDQIKTLAESGKVKT